MSEIERRVDSPERIVSQNDDPQRVEADFEAHRLEDDSPEAAGRRVNGPEDPQRRKRRK